MTDLLLPRVNLARLNDHVLEKMVSFPLSRIFGRGVRRKCTGLEMWAENGREDGQ